MFSSAASQPRARAALSLHLSHKNFSAPCATLIEQIANLCVDQSVVIYDLRRRKRLVFFGLIFWSDEQYRNRAPLPVSMNDPVSVMPNPSPPELSTSAQPYLLRNLPDILPEGKAFPRRAQQQIDLLLLALEALELGGSELMLASAKRLELDGIITNRVALWRLRCSNPWRRSHTHRDLTSTQAKALVLIVGDRAKQLTALLRQLLLAEQQVRGRQLPFDNHFRLSEYLERFRAHFKSRMNSRRVRVMLYNQSKQDLNELALDLLKKLLFCTGTVGTQRLWVSLFDGEVS